MPTNFWNLTIAEQERNDKGELYDAFTDEAWELLNHYSSNDCIELYFLGEILDSDAVAMWCDGYGIVVGRDFNDLSVAHELGHALGLDDCFPLYQKKVGERYVVTYMHCYNRLVDSGTFLVGSKDWGCETGRGYYDNHDSHRVILEQLLMYGYGEKWHVDIPDSKVLSLRKETTNSFDTVYSDVGASGIKKSNPEVFSR